jgi:hypothetical protein
LHEQVIVFSKIKLILHNVRAKKRNYTIQMFNQFAEIGSKQKNMDVEKENNS